MSIKHIKNISMNPHFYAFLMQCFLSGYGKPCDIKSPFVAVPILLYSESREKLVNANKKSRIETLFESPKMVEDSLISGKTRFSGYLERYNYLQSHCKKAMIILASEDKIIIEKKKIILIKEIDYRKFSGAIRDWAKCAYYLGILFAKTTEEHLNYFLGVDTK